ncbi:MAG: glycosyltransferase [Ignavibacteria bacterium]|nr:glycosyltransferase [Ignavibacteria bacterium]
MPVDGAGVSVIINTQNSEEHIERTLRHLIIQKVPKYIPWEIIIADNASKDNTLKIISKTWRKYKGKTPLKIIRLPDTGILEARNQAIENATYNFILFCNPGNLLNRNYVHMVSVNMMRDINLGALGSYTEVLVKGEKPEWFEDWSNYCYQTGEQYEYTSAVTWTKGFVWSSGFAIKKDAWKSIYQKNFKSKFEKRKNETADQSVVEELCYALRATGNSIWYSIDLKLNQIFSESDLSWEHLRNIWKQKGVNFIALYGYIHSKEHELEDFRKLPDKKDLRKLITYIFRSLKRFKRWKLKAYNESLTGDTDVLLIEYKFSKLRELLGEIKPYNRKLRLLRRIARKSDFKYLKYVIDKPCFRFPQYRKRNDKRGISVILNYENTSYNLLNRCLESISRQILPEDFPWEVILNGSNIDENVKSEIYRRWERTNCSASLKIIDENSKNNGILRNAAINKSRYDNLVYLNELDFINPDFVRIAFKSIHKIKK